MSEMGHLLTEQSRLELSAPWGRAGLARWHVGYALRVRRHLDILTWAVRRLPRRQHVFKVLCPRPVKKSNNAY